MMATAQFPKPDCFPTVKMYREWAAMARRADEVASPCTDCTKAYAYAMRDMHLCQKEMVRTVFKITPAKPGGK